MGCLFSKCFSHQSLQEQEAEPAKQYSWDSRPKMNTQDLIVGNVTEGTVYRLPGSVNGQQFIIQNCQNCSIFILDHVATVTIDDCSNCRIVIGPVKSSVFVRDCTECKILTACQQFRSRDCSRTDISLQCVTQPIIESSTTMRFSCFQYHYPQLQEQFSQAGLSVFNNNWSQIHDFTTVANEQNFSLIPLEADQKEYVPVPDPTCGVEVTIDSSTSVVPQTHGLRRKTSNESCFIVFFYSKQSSALALQFIRFMMSKHSSDCVLVQTKEVPMPASEAQRVFATSNYSEAVQRGAVIGLEYNGQAACQLCNEALTEVVTTTESAYYVSPDSSTASKQIDVFYSVADMLMAV